MEHEAEEDKQEEEVRHEVGWEAEAKHAIDNVEPNPNPPFG